MSKKLIKQFSYSTSRGWWGRNGKDVLFTFVNATNAHEFELAVKELLKEASKPRKTSADAEQPKSVDTFFNQGTGGVNRVIRSTKPMT